MKIIFNPLYIEEPILFSIFVIIMILIMIITIVLVKKELGDKK